MFSSANGDIEIPKTIRHAIELVGLLGERYLWVDRLCICQDDEETKASQIDIMGDIYGNALVTIIAASGWDANHGLRGIEGITGPRNLAPNTGDDYFKSLEPQSSIWVGDRVKLSTAASMTDLKGSTLAGGLSRNYSFRPENSCSTIKQRSGSAAAPNGMKSTARKRCECCLPSCQ